MLSNKDYQTFHILYSSHFGQFTLWTFHVLDVSNFGRVLFWTFHILDVSYFGDFGHFIFWKNQKINVKSPKCKTSKMWNVQHMKHPKCECPKFELSKMWNFWGRDNFKCIFRENKIPMTWTIFTIILIGLLIPLPNLFGNPNSIMITRFVMISTIPLVSMIVMNILIYKHLKNLQRAGSFGETVNNAIFKAKMSMIITLTFILSQLIDWIAFGYWVSFQVYLLV